MDCSWDVNAKVRIWKHMGFGEIVVISQGIWDKRRTRITLGTYS